MAYTTVIMNANDSLWTKDNAVPASVNLQSPNALSLSKTTYIDRMTGDAKEGTRTLKLTVAEARFNHNTPEKGEVFAIEINPASIRTVGKFDVCSDYKVLALGKDAVARFIATPAKAEPSATVDNA